ncbi:MULTISPECIES: hypothetical protein [Aeromonas]|jgi:hypothetical protein|uniref:hypothetical protein n=1 Tax=Aeromonas TaxID=642 RepID=UPI001A231148|nr:hypothetical protein [Aeromonas hydrophila]MCK0187951.1 hypothetical protein [Aeromonas hydrophila]UOV94581.1 hypothetical protein MUW98_24580 [Aeromonas hydrophila]HAT2715380.1 hypothetical protein [Aeromonas hydrophila]HAT3533943.1 hypothetical protein [Aeromonas hydrophila]
MNTLSPTQIQRFKKLFPELPEELAGVVMQYAAGATQADIIGVDGHPSRRQVSGMLNKAAKILDLNSLPAIRTVVHTRLYFSLLDLLDQ